MEHQKRLGKKQTQNWVAESADAFAHKIAFDFIAQIEKYIAVRGIERSALAQLLGVSAGAVSQVLNNPQNLKLNTIGKYCQALGIKASVVAYDDGDPKNELGLISSEVFSHCWERLNRPRDNWSLREMEAMYSGTTVVIYVQFFVDQGQNWPYTDFFGSFQKAAPILDTVAGTTATKSPKTLSALNTREAHNG